MNRYVTRAFPLPRSALVSFAIEQLRERGRIGHRDFDHPALAERIVGEHAEVVGQLLVDGGDLATDGSVQVAHRLDAFDLAKDLSLADRAAHFRQLDVHEVGQLMDGEIGDADRRRVPVERDPFMGSGVFQRVRDPWHVLSIAEAVAARKRGSVAIPKHTIH